MDEVTDFAKWLDLYLFYLQARHINEKTQKVHERYLKRINETLGNVVEEDRETLLNKVWRTIKNRETRKKYNQAVKWFKSFQEWVKGEGRAEFRVWLIRQGYSESTAREYYYALIMPAARINRNRKERTRHENAVKAFKRFMTYVFSV